MATAVAAGAAVIATLIVSLLASSLATQNAEQVQLNTAQHLLAAADRASPVDEALLLAIAAYRAAPSSSARDALAQEAALNPGLRRVLRVPSGGVGTAWSVSYSRDGRLLAAAASSPSSDAMVLVWPGDGTGQPAELVLPDAAVATSVAFGPGDKVIAVGGSSGGITLVTVGLGASWPPRLTTGPRLGPPRLHGTAAAGQVSQVSFAPDGKRLAASYSDGTTVVWQLATREASKSFPGSATAFSPAGGTLASIGPTGTVAVRDAATLRLLRAYPAGVANPGNLAYRPDGKMIAITSTTAATGPAPAVAIVDLATHTTRLVNDAIGFGPVAYGSGDEVATNSELIPAASTAAAVPIYRSARIEADSIAFDPTGGLMAVAGSWLDLSGGAVLLLDTSPTTLPATIIPPGGATASSSGFLTSALSPNGRTVAMTASDGAVELLAAATGTPARPVLRPGVELPSRLAFSPGGTALAGVNGRQVTIWSLRDGTAHNFFLPEGLPAAEASGLAFSPDGSLLAVAAPGGQIWLLRTTFPITAMSLPESTQACDLAFSSDGKYLAAATAGGSVFLWDMSTQRQVGLGLESPVPLTAVGFGRGGNTVMSFGAFATAWNIDPQYWLTWACDAVQRNLTAAEWNLYGTGPQIRECDQWAP